MMSYMSLIKHPLTSLHDNSVFFDTYLTKHGLDAALAKHGLRRRVTHIIVPHVGVSHERARSLSRRTDDSL